MENMIDLTKVVAREIAESAAMGVLDADTCFLRDDTKRIYSFVSVPRSRPQKALIVMLARATDHNKMIIEMSHTDTPLYTTLIEAGAPRHQIVRAYAGKVKPEL